MAANRRRLFGSPLGDAKKLARLQIKEAERLLRRGGRAVASNDASAVRAGCTDMRRALGTQDVTEVTNACDRLGLVVDRHLGHLRRPAWRESTESIVIAILIALTIRCFVFEVFQIPSGSMIPTLAIGDKILVNKFMYGLRVPFTAVRLVSFAQPKRGEVVVFIAPMPPHEDYIKRIMAVPGDEIMVQEGVVYVNGHPVTHDPVAQSSFWDKDLGANEWRQFVARVYREKVGDRQFTVLQERTLDPRTNDMGPTQVPDGHVFVMGDNRDHSYDSRRWGMVPNENILGRAMFVLWSWGQQNLDIKRSGLWID